MGATPRELPTIVTARLSLAVGSPRDAEAMAAYLTRNRAFHEPTSPVLTEESYAAAAWGARFEAFREEFARGQSLKLLVRAKDDPEGDVLGVVNYSNIVWGFFRACHLGYALDERWQGRGAMREALEASLAYVFDELGLHRVMANHLPSNERSARLLRALGFVPEGYARDYLYIRGAWRDHVLTARTNPRPVTP
jgi:ribosomal-protein-alanine N-acetyltransferase